MPRQNREFYIETHQVLDAVVIAFSFWAAHALREQLALQFPMEVPAIAPFHDYKWLYLVILPMYPFLLDINGYYARTFYSRQGESFRILIKSSIACVLAVIAVMYFMKVIGLSRGVIVLFGGFSVGVLALKDALFHAYVRSYSHRGNAARHVLLIGDLASNIEFENLLSQHPEWNMKVVGKLQPKADSLGELIETLHRESIACVIFNVGRAYFDDVEKAILACETEGVETWLVADFVRTAIARATIADFHGKPVLMFRTMPDISWQLVAKRLIDIVGSVLGLLILGPLVMLPAAIAIQMTSPGAILFRQKRSGLHGRQFTMLKFRSMVDNAEMLRVELEVFNEMKGPVFKMKKDPRITPVGRWLRKTSADELPQLWNVFKGEMSLVGPRPPIPSEVEKYNPWQRRRLSMKPGLTCLWQIKGRNKLSFDQWMQLDLQYIDNWSLWYDFVIIARTIPVVLSGFGAH